MTEVLPRPRAIDAAVFTDVLSRTLTAAGRASKRIREALVDPGLAEAAPQPRSWLAPQRGRRGSTRMPRGPTGSYTACQGTAGRCRSTGRSGPPATASWSAGHGCMPSRSWTSERTSSRPSASSTGPGSGHHVRPQAPGHASPVGTDRRRRRRPLLPLRTAHPARPGMASGSHGRGPHPLPRPVSRPLQRPGRSVGQRETLGTAPTGDAATAHHHPSSVESPANCRSGEAPLRVLRVFGDQGEEWSIPPPKRADRFIWYGPTTPVAVNRSPPGEFSGGA